MSVRTPQNSIHLGGNKQDASADFGPDLGEGAAGYHNQDPNRPLHRKLAVQIRKTMAELINNPSARTWQPPVKTLGGIFKQTQFVDLNGTTRAVGDLRSTVLHSISTTALKSSFPIQLGVKIAGVDSNTYSSIGNPYSLIAPPESMSNIPVELQKNDVSVAYSFAKQYPGYTARNLRTLNVTPVSNRSMVLVDKGHPIVTAIKENSESLQAANITESPEQLVKISQTLFDTLIPPVELQVKNQINVTNLEEMGITISPADYPTWAAAGEALTKEAVAPIKLKQKRALQLAGNDQVKIEAIKKEFEAMIDDAQASIATTPYEFVVHINVDYNFPGDDSNASSGA